MSKRYPNVIELTCTPTEITKVDSPRLRAIRAALAIDTTGMGLPELLAVWGMAGALAHRLACEEFGARLGWEIPPYQSAEWMEMHRAWLSSEDDE